MALANKVRSLLYLLVFIYFISPVIFKYSTFIQRNLLFMNHVNTQYKFNLSQPETLSIKCARTIRIKYQSGRDQVELGTWHILPESSLPNCISSHENNRTFIEDDHAFSDSRPIVLYIHGNGGNRANHHRGQLYRRLAYEFDYHIITFDYRGYGDSTYLEPTSFGLTEDAHYVYKWLLSQRNVDHNRIFVWGHSLGTAVAVRMVAESSESSRPKRLVLEAPFDSLASAIANHPFSKPFRIMPYFEYFFVEPVESSPELNFDSTKKIVEIRPTPIMILHAEDDGILPVELGQNLYEKGLAELGKENIQFIKISGSLGLGHKHICTHNETMEKVKKFLEIS